MSAYQDVVLNQSPVYYFKAEETAWPVVNYGSANITSNLTQVRSFDFNQSGGINNTKCWYSSSNTAGFFTHNDTTSVFNDGVFSLSLWVKFPSKADPYNQIFITYKAGQASGFISQLITNQTTSNTILEVAGPSAASQFSLGNISDNKWHHIALVINGTTWTAYLDNVSKTRSGNTQTISTGDAQDKYWFGPNSGNDGFNGYVDEPAIFNFALSGSQIDDQYQAGAGVNNLASVLTASGLMVQPATTTTRNPNYAASPATASALMPDHRVSNFNTTITLDQYLTSLDLANYFKFDTTSVENYGDSGNTTWFFVGPKTLHQTNGPSNMPYVTADQITTTVGGGGGSQPIWAGPIVEDDWTVGIWFRKTTTEATTLVEFLDNSYNSVLNLGLTEDGYLTGTYVTAGEDSLTLTDDTDLTDGKWYFAALSWSWETEDLQLYLNDALVSNGGLAGTATTFNRVNLSGNCDIAAFVVDYASVLTESIMDNIYAYGSQFIQGSVYMPQDVKVSISTAFYDFLGTAAQTQLKFDGVGLPEDDGSNPASWGLNGDSADITSAHISKNIYSYKFTDKESFYETNVTADYSNDAFTVLALFKVNPALMSDENENGYGAKNIIYGAPIPGIAPVILGVTDTDYFAYISDSGFAHETFSYGGALDDQYHLLGVTKNGQTFKFFIDGKLIDTQELDLSIESTNGTGYGFVGGNEVGWFFQTAAVTEKYIDYVGTFNFESTESDMFEIWQSIGIDVMEATNATFELPVGITGYGPTIHPGVMYVSALLVDPTQQDTVAPTILPMTVFGAFAHPNFAGTANATISATALTASADFENAVWSVGEINGALHMSASAEMGDARAYIPGFWNAAPMIASTATMVQPGFASTRGGLWNASALTAKAQFVLPPAYKSLQDDLWYRLLFLQHSTVNGELGNSGTSSATAFLKLFDDVTSDLSGANTSKIINNLPYRIVVDTPSDTSSTVTYAYSENEYTTAANTPVLEVGYFDEFQRKAVRFNNIQFKINQDIYTSDRPYSVEFTFKTTKANQIIAQGKWNSFLYSGRRKSAIGLVDGKLYSLSSYIIDQTLHPKNTALRDIEGRVNGTKRIDDGLWHHIVIQYGLDGRTQFWIDGELDIQMYADSFNSGSNIRPFIIGYNSKDDAYQSNFYTSAWSYDAATFISQQDIVLHNAASFKYEPIKAEPMVATARLTTDTKAAGNRGRALMLYFWPVNTELARTEDTGKYGPFDEETFDSSVLTIDYIQNPPQQWYGWDLYPVDINGYYVSDLVKAEAYGGEQNIVEQVLGGFNLSPSVPKFKANRKGWFRDPKTDDRRYIDLIKDIDLSNFEVILFRNYPDQSQELDKYARNEVVDSYFNIRESAIFEDFIKSLRSAIDTGIGLYITNHQLALDLGIIDGYQEVSDLDDLGTDLHAPTLTPAETQDYPIEEDARWLETFKNNRLRVVNTVAGLTDIEGAIWKDMAYYQNSDTINYGGADRPFHRFEPRPNGIAAGDEFIISDFRVGYPTKYLAVPFANIKAGKPVTAFANNYYRGNELVENPYRNYATSIVVEPGNQLNGKPISGKIYVNFTERMSSSTLYSERPHGAANDYGWVDLIQDDWINFSYENGGITLDEKNTLLTSPNNIDRKLEAGTITQTEYNKLAYWSSNGMYILGTAKQEIGIIDTTAGKSTIAKERSKGQVKRFNKKGVSTTGTQAYSTTQFFSFAYSWRFARTIINAPSMITRGFWWLSDRETLEGLVNRVPATTASVTMPNAVVTVDKIISLNAAPMIVAANMGQPTNYAGGSVKIAPVPFQAYALITQWVINQVAQPMLATAQFRQDNRAITSAVDEVVLYVMHEDPILYVREDVIK